jgi:hypothetical protein
VWKKARLALAICLLIPLTTVLAQAQDSELQIHLRRTFGYRAGSQIQGRFTLELSNDLELVEVTYLIDGNSLASASASPYRVSFSTGDFPPGKHVLSAVGSDSSGARFDSQRLELTFVTAEQGWQTGGRIAGWVLGVVLVLMLIGALGTNVLSRGKAPFKAGTYGAAGGAVCGRCQLPFSRHVLSPNLMIGKLERCPHCGRIAIVPRASRVALDQAEERYRQDGEQGKRATGSEREQSFQQRLEDSRFDH